jgi:potassium channel subfamily K
MEVADFLGYGDLSPKSNFGKPFFVVWSILAIPTMTILIGDLGNTVIAGFVDFTHKLGDYTILPQAGLWRKVLDKNPWLLLWLQKYIDKRAGERRIDEGFPAGPEVEEDFHIPTLEELAAGDPDEHDLARKLAAAIRHVANELHFTPPKVFSYNEWAEYTRLIRFTRMTPEEVEMEEDEEHGLLDWDWIGEDSPMLASISEAEWILDRLTESLDRYVRKQVPLEKRRPGAGKRASEAMFTTEPDRAQDDDDDDEEIGPDQ